ncbi:MAG: peptide-methionine (S)-S-oxide reductase MsrA [bacterium]|nr:peptide-methionine (S)-S-oxide reductase MsrA [bacterium]
MSEKAVFGGGCFWCTEAVFKALEGVSSVKPGYAGGTVAHPTYLQVASGKTGHAEVIYIEYDPNKISYHTLLTIFFASHDPTTLNRQGNDIGTQYRSVIFYTTETQKAEAEKFIAEINASNQVGAPVVTEVVPLETFYEAENYHHDYYANNKNAPYCQIVINPKLDKVHKEFSKLLKQLPQKAPTSLKYEGRRMDK